MRKFAILGALAVLLAACDASPDATEQISAVNKYSDTERQSADCATVNVPASVMANAKIALRIVNIASEYNSRPSDIANLMACAGYFGVAPDQFVSGLEHFIKSGNAKPDALAAFKAWHKDVNSMSQAAFDKEVTDRTGIKDDQWHTFIEIVWDEACGYVVKDTVSDKELADLAFMAVCADKK